ncbi:serpin family protein [Actinomadura barringtoniae]|uniref:Serpin family protein n=1 Tax=Actinomadura barringtoniae TaxID=1427535 RepID=A0A939TCI4_9ACTN|nr:serpin family protein [Actinomadura barringtoniae]MBO2451285.1 serpin family protein [Actinomadura barringtoniae]
MGYLRTSTALGCLAAVSLATACGSGKAQGGETVTLRGAVAHVPAADPRPYAAADSAFGLDMLKAWCGKDPESNVVLSPSSLSSGLGMVYLAAKGDTARTMAGTLKLPAGDPLAGLHARNQALKGLGGKDVTISTSDQVWADKQRKPDSAYLDKVATAYDAGLKSLDIQGDPEGARKAINDAIKKSTQGKISDLLPQGSVKGDTGWVLTDAVYLKAKWAVEFKKTGTHPEPFTTGDGKQIKTDTMSRSGEIGYAHTGGWTAVDLPYTGNKVSLTALLPDSKAQGCPSLDAATLRKVTGALQPSLLDVHLPKVDLKSKGDMKPFLTSLGMGKAFNGPADFTGISPDAGKLQFVQHAATMRVDEKGTEAAAATGSGMEATSAVAPARTDVFFDRPYVLIVRDNTTGVPLFAARVADPSKS